MTNMMTRDRTHTSAPLEPYRVIRDLLGWDPFREANWLPTERAVNFVPTFEVKETKGAYLFKADLPGIKQDDVDINLLGNRLTISGKREQERKEDTDSYHLMERSYGSFSRTFNLPDGVQADHIHAELKEGVLNLSIPKLPESQPQKVKLQK